MDLIGFNQTNLFCCNRNSEISWGMNSTFWLIKYMSFWGTVMSGGWSVTNGLGDGESEVRGVGAIKGLIADR